VRSLSGLHLGLRKKKKKKKTLLEQKQKLLVGSICKKVRTTGTACNHINPRTLTSMTTLTNSSQMSTGLKSSLTRGTMEVLVSMAEYNPRAFQHPHRHHVLVCRKYHRTVVYAFAWNKLLCDECAVELSKDEYSVSTTLKHARVLARRRERRARERAVKQAPKKVKVHE
jgi:hypothetical protein